MSQITSGVTFSNAKFGGGSLYVAEVQGSEFAAVLLPAGSTYTETLIDLPTAFQQQVYFLFSRVELSNTSTDNYQKYLSAFRTGTGIAGFLGLAWILDTSLPLSANNTTVINLVQYTAGGDFVVAKTTNLSIGNNFATLNIDNNTVVTCTPLDAPANLEFFYNSRYPNISFANKTIGTQSLFNSNMTIPFGVAGTGSFRFALGLNLKMDFQGYGLQNNYYYLISSVLNVFTYPILQPGISVNEYAITQTQIDLLDIGNAGQLNTYFALTGKIYNTASGNNRDANFPSYSTINTGYPIGLVPFIDLETTTALINNIYPTTYTARFVISPSPRSATNQVYYMVPEGDFYLDMSASPTAIPDENGQFNFLPGLSGTEVITFSPYHNSGVNPVGDRLRFISRQPAFAPNFPSEPVSLALPGTDNPVLTSEYLTSWANIVSSSTANVQYACQPQGASLYAKGHGIASEDSNSSFLGFFEPSVDMPQNEGFYVPMVPYLGIPAILPPGTGDIKSFESKVLSSERKAKITNSFSPSNASKSKAKRAMLSARANGSGYTPSTTPQGLVANVMDTGTWSLLNLAQNVVDKDSSAHWYVSPVNQVPDSAPEYQLGFINLSQELQSAFLTNQQFVVMTNNQHLGTLFSTIQDQAGGTSAEAIFNNKMSIEDWPFDFNVGSNNTYADYNNVLLFKFCQGTVLDRVKNPKDWTQANAFNIAPDALDGSYNQLVAISSWLQSYLQAAENAYHNAEHSADKVNYYEKFHQIINDPNWNGILALKADINLQEFPQQLKGLISGINLKNFNAHHVGVEVNRVDATGTITMGPVSSIFGLINYVDPAYGVQVGQGLSADKPIPPLVNATYDFKVLSLQVLFENTAIKSFSSKIQLTMNNLFSDQVSHTNNKYGAAKLNTVVLNGTYQDHNGTAVYIFDNKDDNLFYFDSNLLQNVEITKIQFNTLTTDPLAVDIETRFLMWGFLNFGVITCVPPQPPPPPEVDPGTLTAYIFDAWSFGIKEEEDVDYQKGLNYADLYIEMGFNLKNPSVVSYAFDAGQVSFNSSQSNTREGSLYPNFALSIDKLMSGNDESAPSSQGFLTLGLPGVNANGLSGDWFGLQMNLNLGSPGELAGNLGFNASLLLAWSPGEQNGSNKYNILIGIKLPGTSSNAKLLSIQGLLKLTIDKLRLQYIPAASAEAQGSYLLTLSNIALKFLGILKLPPGGSTNFLLFGNPMKGATSSSLGWYASYNKMP